MKRVLVTGASGFIGRQTLAPLLELGYEVHALQANNRIESDPRIIWHAANLLEENISKKLCELIKPTHLLHFAWYLNPKDFKTSPENERWAKTSLSLLKAFAEAGGKRAVMAGTCNEYDWSIPQDTFKEITSPLGPSNFYGNAKNQLRIEAGKYAAENDISFAWGRIFFVYGPHEAQERLIPQVIKALSESRTPNIPGGGLVRDYSYVKDIGSAFAALLDGNVKGIVNVASGIPITLKDIARTMADILRKPEFAEAVPDAIPPQEPARIVADITRLRDEVHWKSHYDLRKGLEETINVDGTPLIH